MLRAASETKNHFLASWESSVVSKVTALISLAQCPRQPANQMPETPIHLFVIFDPGARRPRGSWAAILRTRGLIVNVLPRFRQGSAHIPRRKKGATDTRAWFTVLRVVPRNRGRPLQPGQRMFHDISKMAESRKRVEKSRKSRPPRLSLCLAAKARAFDAAKVAVRARSG